MRPPIHCLLVVVAIGLATSAGAVICRSKSGALFERSSCKKREVQTAANVIGAKGDAGQNGAKGDPGQNGANGDRGAAGSARAYAHVIATSSAVSLDAARTKGFNSVTRCTSIGGAHGCYCLSAAGIDAATSAVLATPDGENSGGFPFTQIIDVSKFFGGSCPVGTFEIDTKKVNVTGASSTDAVTFEDFGFFVLVP